MTNLRFINISALLLAFVGLSPTTHAQITHSDVFFRYGETKIEIEPQGGRLVIPQIFPDSGFFAQANANPGFFSEKDLGGGTGANDIVVYNVLDNLLFWTDGEFHSPATETEIHIINNPNFVEDTIIGAATGEQRATFDPLTNSIGQASSDEEFHSHIDFRLTPNPSDGDDPPATGAYGIKVSLSSDNPAVKESDPFLIVYQFGIEDDAFASALDDFAKLLLPTEMLLGDFDADGILSTNDIDLLSSETNSATPNATFDLTADGQVDETDRVFWIDQLANSLGGDTDLNHKVEFADFLQLSAAFGQEGGWANGDFDGNRRVEFADFLVLSSNFGSSIGESQSVPEPNSQSLALVGLLVGLGMRRRKYGR